MIRLLPTGLALLGLGMFVLSFWFQEPGLPVARWTQSPHPLPEKVTEQPAAPAPAAEEEPDSLAVTTKPVP